MKPTSWTRRFERACREWQVRLGLTDWTLSFKLARDNGTRQADVAYDVEGRQATVTAYVKVVDASAPERVALHEMLHLLLADTLAVAAARASDTHADVGREEHKIIERLLNVIDGRP